MIDLSRHPSLFSSCCVGLLSGVVLASAGCSEDLPCGLSCPADGITEGNASISGTASLDAFFGAVIAVRNAAGTVSGNMEAELRGLAVSLEIEGYADMNLDELATAVSAGIEAKLSAYVDGGLTINYQPAVCKASVEVAAEAVAECDVDIEPGSVEASCMGSCEVSAEVAADCQAMGTLECTGKAPDFQCSGTCSGDCQLEAAAECSGTCSGRCEGSCSACTGGACETDGMGVVTNCAGSCDAGCEGTCKLEASASCEGRCEGECTYDPGGAECEAGATAKCDVSGMAEASCQGSCEGEVVPPSASAECEASVEAKANASVQCVPPSLSVEFAFNANIDADGQAEFKIWLEGFKARYAGMVASVAKLDSVELAASGLISASASVIPNAVTATLDAGGLSISQISGLGCALTELESVGTALADAQASISGSVSAFATISATVGG